MRAVVITRPGGPEVLELRDVARPEPGPGQIRVAVRASALSRADLLQRRGGYPAPPGAPADIPGLEYAGVVDALGPGATLWRPGDRVMGLVAGGGHAEAVVVHEREAVAVPERLSFIEAAGVPEVFVTAQDALFTRLGLGLGEMLLIHAVGSGVGTAALQLAHLAGATTIGVARTAWKLERAKELGLDHAIHAPEPRFADAVLGITGGRGVDCILDLVGGAYLADNLRALATHGRMVVVGTVAGSRGELDLRTLMSRRLTLIGTVLRARPLEEKIDVARRLAHHVVPLLADGRIRVPVDSVFAPEQAGEAHLRLESNQTFGKVVIDWQA